jgi:hypothetical protein
MRLILLHVPDAVVYVPLGLGLAVLLVLVWGADGFRQRWVRLGCAVLVVGFLAGLAAQASKANADSLMKTANERIASLRKASAQIRVVDAKGNPVAGANVRVEQRRHAFLFGCNAFRMFYNQDQLNPLYAARFSALFNYAALPSVAWVPMMTKRRESARPPAARII